jgi:hypothetical protein
MGSVGGEHHGRASPGMFALGLHAGVTGSIPVQKEREPLESRAAAAAENPFAFAACAAWHVCKFTRAAPVQQQRGSRSVSACPLYSDALAAQHHAALAARMAHAWLKRLPQCRSASPVRRAVRSAQWRQLFSQITDHRQTNLPVLASPTTSNAQQKGKQQEYNYSTTSTWRQRSGRKRLALSSSVLSMRTHLRIAIASSLVCTNKNIS